MNYENNKLYKISFLQNGVLTNEKPTIILFLEIKQDLYKNSQLVCYDILQNKHSVVCERMIEFFYKIEEI